MSAAHSSDAAAAALAVPVAAESDDATSKLTIAEAAQALDVSPATVYRRILSGELPATREGRTLRIERRTILEIGPLRRHDAPRSQAQLAAMDRGALAAQCFPLFSAAVPLDDVVVRLAADPQAVAALFRQWCELRALSAQYLTPAAPPGPMFDHPPSVAWDCCPGHQAMHRMEKTGKT